MAACFSSRVYLGFVTLAGPAAELARVFGRQAGDGPVGELAAAAWVLLDAVWPFRGRADLPDELARVVADLPSVLPARNA